ncbi:MAG: hypothetical protein QXD02_01605 [Candidatus Parvarchaeum sp.]|nr:hypothetical protein [Candidatus Parvarchaeum tengchongense]MCW1295817.1 hypothetical protein [Candidatus Parvarchaeum tengchongense]MCW1299002.1 hypothetical protein [Candidatus Parvarchaeum tengchongense]
MGASLDDYTISREEELAQERKLADSKNYIKDTAEDINKKGMKGLEALLSVFSDLSKSNAPMIAGEEYLRGEMKNLDYKLKDVEDVVRDERLYKGIETTESLGIAISAAINNVIKPGEKVHIKSPKPIDNLFYNLKDAEGHVDIAGDYLGKHAVNSKIFAKNAGHSAGEEVVNSELHIYEVSNALGENSKNSKIYVNKARDWLGNNSKGNLIFARETGNYTGSRIEDTKLYVDKAGDDFACYAINSEIHFNEVGDGAAERISHCNVYGRKAGKEFGVEAGSSKMYVDELGDNACQWMENSKLYFKKLDGKLGSWYIDVNVHNKVYKNGSRYILPNIKHEAEVMNYKIKDYLKRIKDRFEPEPEPSWALLLFYLGGNSKK